MKVVVLTLAVCVVSSVWALPANNFGQRYRSEKFGVQRDFWPDVIAFLARGRVDGSRSGENPGRVSHIDHSNRTGLKTGDSRTAAQESPAEPSRVEPPVQQTENVSQEAVAKVDATTAAGNLNEPIITQPDQLDFLGEPGESLIQKDQAAKPETVTQAPISPVAESTTQVSDETSKPTVAQVLPVTERSPVTPDTPAPSFIAIFKDVMRVDPEMVKSIIRERNITLPEDSEIEPTQQIQTELTSPSAETETESRTELAEAVTFESPSDGIKTTSLPETELVTIQASVKPAQDEPTIVLQDSAIAETATEASPELNSAKELDTTTESQSELATVQDVESRTEGSSVSTDSISEVQQRQSNVPDQREAEEVESTTIISAKDEAQFLETTTERSEQDGVTTDASSTFVELTEPTTVESDVTATTDPAVRSRNNDSEDPATESTITADENITTEHA